MGGVITYNPFIDRWLGAKRENSNDLFSNKESENVLKTKDIPTLIDLIIRTQGDQSKLKKLVYDGKK